MKVAAEMLTKADKWLIGILLVISITGIIMSMSMVTQGSNRVAEIRVNGQLVKQMPLRAGYHEEFKVGGQHGFNIIQSDNGKVRMQESDCPDQICVQTGWIEHAPQQIVCLPYRVVVKIVSSDNNIDDIAR